MMPGVLIVRPAGTQVPSVGNLAEGPTRC